jgi:hypothetical protein
VGLDAARGVGIPLPDDMSQFKMILCLKIKARQLGTMDPTCPDLAGQWILSLPRIERSLPGKMGRNPRTDPERVVYCAPHRPSCRCCGTVDAEFTCRGYGRRLPGPCAKHNVVFQLHLRLSGRLLGERLSAVAINKGGRDI